LFYLYGYRLDFLAGGAEDRDPDNIEEKIANRVNQINIMIRATHMTSKKYITQSITIALMIVHKKSQMTDDIYVI
jgi:hypothetical protein